ncbi:hypothetical protein [Streptomyces sp. NPDC018833]|uniref:hypothetical protein n=1 Tax=Streptomyces sp. NPDC018833 TaxID=3365053 RepID=UPI0037981FAA
MAENEITVGQALEVLTKKLKYLTSATGHVERVFVANDGGWATITVRVPNRNEDTKREHNYIQFATRQRGWIDKIRDLSKGDYVTVLSLDHENGRRKQDGSYTPDRLMITEFVRIREVGKPVAAPEFLKGLVNEG